MPAPGEITIYLSDDSFALEHLVYVGFVKGSFEQNSGADDSIIPISTRLVPDWNIYRVAPAVLDSLSILNQQYLQLKKKEVEEARRQLQHKR